MTGRTGFDRLTRQLVAALEAHLATGAAPEVPEAGRLLWRMFLELHATRTSNGYAPDPLSFGEITSWARAMGWPLEPRHVATLRAMDAAWMGARASSSGAGGRRIAGNLTPEAFDAWLT